MKEEAILIGISQLGAVFAGFISIFMIFARKDGRFSPADALLIHSIISSSFLIVLGALMPLLLFDYGLADEMAWRYSAWITVIVACISTCFIARRHIVMSAEDRAEVGLFHSIFAWGVAGVSVIILVLLGFGIGVSTNYLLVLVLTLAVGISNFVTIALRRLL